MTTLDQEKFDTVKAIADMQTSLSEGQAALLKLKETTEEYMVVREQEAEERVKKVLELSHEALVEVAKNHDELTKYSEDLKGYAGDLNKLAGGISELFKGFVKSMGEADEDMKGYHENISNILTQVKTQRIHVEEDRKMLERERQETNDQARKVMADRGTLERGFAELKKLKDKTI